MNRRGLIAGISSTLCAGCLTRSPVSCPTASGDERGTGMHAEAMQSGDCDPDPAIDVQRARGVDFDGKLADDNRLTVDVSGSGTELVVYDRATLPDSCSELRIGEWTFSADTGSLTIEMRVVDPSPSGTACETATRQTPYALAIQDGGRRVTEIRIRGDVEGGIGTVPQTTGTRT